MAEDKKAGAKKPEAPAPSMEGQMLFYGFIALIVLFIIAPSVISFLGYTSSDVTPSAGFFDRLWYSISSFVDALSFIAVFLILMLSMAYYYLKMRIHEIAENYEKSENAGYKPSMSEKHAMMNASGMKTPISGAVGSVASGVVGAVNGVMQKPEVDPRWKDIQNHMQSNNQSDWRIAILEADIILYDMLTAMGLEGDSIGEMLKNADPQSFVTINDAWRAHKIRNIIAHEGANYNLHRHEAEQTLALFKRVFDEFYFV